MDQTHHLSYVICDMFEQYILDDKSIILNKKLYKQAYKITDMLADFYQQIGSEIYRQTQGEKECD